MLELKPRRPDRPRELPVGYHLAHFREMLTFVERVYGPVLGSEQCAWLCDFVALEPQAQSLFVRIANRKGSVFRTDKLAYTDVPDISAACEALAGVGFVAPLSGEDFDAALATLSKTDLLLALSRAPAGDDIRKSWTRAQLIGVARARLSFDDCFPSEIRSRYVVQRRRRTLRYLLYLYFGRIEQSLTRFALRDLGIVRTHSFRDAFEARFETREQAETSFFYADLLDGLTDTNAQKIRGLLGSVDGWPATDELTAPLRDTLLYALGRSLERAGDTAAARGVYECGESADCGERAIRLAYAAGERDSVRERLEVMIADPVSDEGALFAQDFLARKFGGKRTSVVTDLLRAAEVIGVDESQRASPERGALNFFRRKGWAGLHAENTPWRTLFGLLFWDILYGSDTASLHNAFERMPEVLRARTMLDQNGNAVEARLALLDDPDRALTALLKVFSAEHGTPNAIFRWHEDMIERLQPLLTLAPRGGLARVMREIARDYPARKDGFPDLMLWRDDALRLIEIKTSGDSLRRNQLLQLGLLREAGFDVTVNRVDWIVDPDQTYVVVDIETTGGRAPLHRITEIGAVKVQNGKMVDRWQSLVNPQRSIPASITRLTGITNAMVADAPVFAEIADGFETFMGEAIFVAHNVRFDHGFLAAEYARLERRFRYPQLCTCQSMRTLFKGLPSYSLGNLCRHFDISLPNHHRALCDAEAAAGLLELINDKRVGA